MCPTTKSDSPHAYSSYASQLNSNAWTTHFLLASQSGRPYGSERKPLKLHTDVLRPLFSISNAPLSHMMASSTTPPRNASILFRLHNGRILLDAA